MRVLLRALRGPIAFAALLLTPGIAYPQSPVYIPSAFICTPDGQVLKQSINANGTPGATQLWFTEAGSSFDDCVIGPDGWLYIATGLYVRRLNPDTQATAAASVENVNSDALPSAARSLAFNLNTLYINTQSSGIYTLTGTPGVPLTFPTAPAALVSVSPSEGHGVAFDVMGNLVLASGGTVQRSSWDATARTYTAAQTLATSGNTVFGVAVNTCGEVVYADKASRSVKRILKNGTLAENPVVTFAAPNYPIAIEIDSSNKLYIVTAQSDAGASAMLWRATPQGSDPISSCAGATASLLLDVASKLTGGGKIKELLSSRALGVAITPTDYSITHTFGPLTPNCTKQYDFGYYRVSMKWAHCETPFSFTIDALKSKPSDVSFNFDPNDPNDPTARGIPYSPMGGFNTQFVFHEPTAGNPFPFSALYWFFTQESLYSPGIARADSHAPTAPYTEGDQMVNFWELSNYDTDPMEEVDIFTSKHVTFNSSQSADCTVKVYDEPFESGIPLFKEKQTVKIAFNAFTSLGVPCGQGATMHISVAKVSPAIELMPVASAGNAQTGNIMSSSGNRFWFNLSSAGYGTGTFLVTVWGDFISTATKTFMIQQ